jgi:peptidyl-prolyl cis-trans isomerase D
MPIMVRLRENMVWIFAGLVAVFLFSIVFDWGMGLTGMRDSSRNDAVGSIYGKKVTQKEFSDVLRGITDNAKAQSGREVDEAQMAAYRNQAWQAIVNERLITNEVKKLGLTVSDEELQAWVYGDNPPQDLTRYFIDSTGRFDRERYEAVLHNPNQAIVDPQGADPNYGVKRMKEFEEQLRTRRLQEKLTSLVSASVRVTDGELRQRFDEERMHLEARYVFFDPNVLVKDADVMVSDADLRSYYDENVDQFKFDASRKLKYAVMANNPTSADTTSRRENAEKLAKDARAGADFLELVAANMDRPDSGSFFRRGELSAPLEQAVFTAQVGDIVGPIQDPSGFHVVKVLDVRKGATEYLHAQHILFGVNGPDSNDVKARAQQVLADAKSGKDFSALAAQYSTEPGASRSGGELGWFAKGRMVPAFEKAAFGASTGQVVGLIRTQFGLHIIKVLGRDNREVKIAQITENIAATEATKNDIAERARDLAYNAKSTDLVREAQQIGLDVRETQIQEKGGVIPGIGVNESISRWAFDAKKGAISEPYAVTNGWAVFTIIETKDAGVRSFDEVKESLRPAVLRKKKLEKAKEIASGLRANLQAGDSLAKLTTIDPTLAVQTTGAFSANGVVPGVGRDAAFLGTASALTVGQVSPAVIGNRGAFLIQLTQKSDVDSSGFSAQKEMLRSRLMQEKRGRFITDWLAQLKEKADIEDNRDKFYR